MSNREKVILIVMVLVVLGGGYSLFFSGDDDKGSSVTATIFGKDQLEDTKKFVGDVREKVKKEMERPSDAPYIIARASAEWGPDPFLERKKAVVFNAEAVKDDKVPDVSPEELGLAYTGYLAAGDNILAVINGLEYGEGEKLEMEGGYIVKSISPVQVVIGREGSAGKIIVPLEETEF